MGILSTQDFANFAGVYGVQRAAVMFLYLGAGLSETQIYMRAAMRGMRVRFTPFTLFEWLPETEMVRGERWIDISTIASPYQEQVDENSTPPRYRHRAMARIERRGAPAWRVPGGEWMAGPAPAVRK